MPVCFDGDGDDDDDDDDDDMGHERIRQILVVIRIAFVQGGSISHSFEIYCDLGRTAQFLPPSCLTTLSLMMATNCVKRVEPRKKKEKRMMTYQMLECCRMKLQHLP